MHAQSSGAVASAWLCTCLTARRVMPAPTPLGVGPEYQIVNHFARNEALVNTGGLIQFVRLDFVAAMLTSPADHFCGFCVIFDRSMSKLFLLAIMYLISFQQPS